MRRKPRGPGVPLVVVVAGVAGTGKTTIGEETARRLDWAFQEGDLLHDVVNVEKMRRGEPLSDADRQPWLLRVAEWCHTQLDAGRSSIVTCSALKRRYRDLLRQGRRDILVAVLLAPEEIVEQRMVLRRGHFMPATLLPSQFATLERPTIDEDAIVIDTAGSVEHAVTMLIHAIRRRASELAANLP